MTKNPPNPEQEAAISDALTFATHRQCPKCLIAYLPKRKNQTYCSRDCQKNAARGPRTGSASVDQRYDNMRDWCLLGSLNETYYHTRPDERLGLIKDWLDRARAGDGRLSRVLSKPAFRVSHRDDPKIYYRRSWAYPPVPILADRFCIRFRGCRVWEWTNGSAGEPETGEVTTINPPPAYEVVAPLTSTDPPPMGDGRGRVAETTTLMGDNPPPAYEVETAPTNDNPPPAYKVAA